MLVPPPVTGGEGDLPGRTTQRRKWAQLHRNSFGTSRVARPKARRSCASDPARLGARPTVGLSTGRLEAPKRTHGGLGADESDRGVGWGRRGGGNSGIGGRSDLERRAATAGASHVRIAELEAGPMSAFDVVNFGTVEILKAEGIYVEIDAM